MAGALKPDYVASTAITVTNLHGTDASSTFVAGWNSAAISNRTNEYDDYMVGGVFVRHATVTAGTIIVGIIGALSDGGGTPVWPTVASGTVGTEGALAFTAVEQMNTAVRVLCRIPVTNTASQVYSFPMTGIKQLFGDNMPTDFCVFVTSNGASGSDFLASSGSAIYYTPTLGQYT